MTDGLRNRRDFTVRVRFDSDWTYGTGTGRHGSVDRQVLRDADDFPMLGGKAMAAMMRDAAETVARGLDDGQDGPWQAWVEAVFGSQPALPGRPVVTPPVPSVLVARPLRLPADLRTAILARDDAAQVAEAAFVFRSGVKIGRNGVADDDTLRIEERARAGLTVEALWRLDFPHLDNGEPVPWEAELLLTAAASTVTAVGGRRRRGAGRCVVTLPSRLPELLDRIDEAQPPPRQPPAGADTVVLGVREGDPLVLAHELRITTVGPVVAIRRVRGNAVLTEEFVPGTVLLPLVARAVGAAATGLITAGRLVVSNATMEIDGRRSDPVPRALRGGRTDDEHEITNLLHPADPGGHKPRLLSGFCTATDTTVRLGRPELVERAHAVIEDERQRPTADSGGLFVNQAIAPGTVLRAQVWLPPGTPFDVEAVAGERSLGRSRKDDYGQVRVEVCPPGAVDGLDDRLERASADGELLVWLLSDVLLRGANGEPEPTVDRLAQVLGDRLGVTLTEPTAFVTTGRVESWQTRWALPRPSLVGLRAGSVLRFAAAGTFDRHGWRRAEADGIGGRTAEGFGRVALHAAFLCHPRLHLIELADRPSATTSATTPADVPAHPDLERLLTWRWRAELRSRALTVAADDAKRAELVPPAGTAAQLGALRTLADRLLTDNPDTTAVGSWIAAARGNTGRRSAWGRNRLDLLGRLVTTPGEPWAWLGLEPDPAVAGALRIEALAWTLAEVARTQARARQTIASDRNGKGRS